MRPQDNIDFTTLTWVKPELDETLRQARNALQSYVEEGENPAELKACAGLLHQVQGTLRMVELYGAAMVAEEMEQLSKALVDGKIEKRDDAYAVLMQGIVQLPDYLERLQSGHRDIPIVLLPLLNSLRDARGEKGLAEDVLFSPDLSRPLPASAAGPAVPMPHDELRRRAEALRNLYQGALLRWLKDDNSTATVRDLTDVCEQLVQITTAESARRLFWVAAGTLDALGKNAFPVSNPLKQALSKVEREIKRLADGADSAFRSDPPIDLTRQLLYFVAHENSDHGRIGEIREVFGLSANVPSEAELAHARGSLTGHNRALLETVAGAIKEDLMRVKDALDLHLRTTDAAPGDLLGQVEALDRIADTLGMIGLGVPRRVVQEQRTAIHDVTTGQRRNDEATLLDIAGALLYVEASLDDQVERLGRGDTGSAETTAMPLPDSESRKVMEVLLKEAIGNFAQARQCFVAFVETHWDHAQLADVPRLLEEVSGALRILDIQPPSHYLTAVRRFTEKELLQRHRVPNGQQMDRLADTLASLEYFLEALRDRRPNRDQILDVARKSLEALGYWPLPAEEAAAPPPPKPAAPAPVAAPPAPAAATPAPPAPAPVAAAPTPTPAPVVAEPEAPKPVPVVEAVTIPVAAAPVAVAPVAVALAAASNLPVVPGFDGASSEEIDDEIREVFLEEFEEEIGNLEQLLPPWRNAPDNGELLRPIRRVFHTLKGSGRLVGAKTLGEFSWKVENMLNRVLDGTRPASPAVIALIEHAFNQLPLLRAALQGETVHADLEGIQAVAERLATGEEALYQPSVLAMAAADIPTGADIGGAPVEPEVAEAAAAVEAPVVADVGGEPAPAFAIDPVLFEILKPEVAGHLETVDAWLAQCAARGPQPITDPLLRSIHTMNGAFAMTEISVITDVTAPVEGYLKRALAHHQTPNAEGVAVIADTAAAIRKTITALEASRPQLPEFADLSARAHALRDALPDSSAPMVPVSIEPEEIGIMPQAVVLETPDVSAIPDFADATVTEVGIDLTLPSAPVEEEPVVEAAIEPEPEPVAASAEPPVVEAEIEPVVAAPEVAPVEAEPVVSEALPELEETLLPVEAEESEPAFAAEHIEPVAEEGVAELAEADLLPPTELLSLDDFAVEEKADLGDFSFDEGEIEDVPLPVVEAPMAIEEEAADLGETAPEQAEEAVAETAQAEPVQTGEESLPALEADDALASMIAAFASEPAAAVVPSEPEAVEPETSEPAASEAVMEEAVETAAAAPAGDDFYGLSLDELEALTAPATEAPVDADVPVAADLTPEGSISADAEAPVVAEVADIPSADSVEALETGADAVAEFETVETDAVEKAAAEEAEAEIEAEAEATEEVEEAELLIQDEPEEVAAEEPVAAAPEPVVHAARVVVPLAMDPSDPDEALDTSDLDTDLLDIFLEESTDILDHSDGMLAKLRDDANDRELVTGLQRDLHTLKGGARMAGIYAVGDLGHSMESLLEAVAEGRRELDETGIVVLERGFDRLHAMVGRIGERKAIALPAGLIAQVEALAAGMPLEAEAAPETAEAAETGATETPAAPVRAATPAPAAPAAPLKPLSAPMEAMAEEDETSGMRAPQEQVRIRADLLDRLVNYAGEVAIYRARLEQQLGAFRANLAELNQTTDRLREQLRRLDIETEAQIVARYQREDETNDETFDPLELDRFTTQQQLSRSLAESANDLVNLQVVLDDLTRQYETLLLQQSRVSSDLQEGLMRTRMVPFDAMVPRLRRVLRQAASDTGKQVQLKVDGASGEMDRNVLDRMTAPLEHMLRNSMAHGLEAPADRRRAGKSEEGTVRIAVSREGSEVVLKVSDDGRGLDKKAIRAKAIERGLIAADAEMPDEALYGLILETGFSTAETVSRLAGRGVGMDVVYSEIRQLGGSLQIRSEEGKGSEFIIRLPFTLAVTQAVFVKIGDTSYAVPIASVQGVGRISRADLDKQLAGDKPVFDYAGEEYSIHDLGHLIGHASAKAQDSLQMPLLLARSGDLRAAICVDQVLGSREIVVKPVGPQVNSVPGIFGATIMGDGRVVVILDVAPLVRRHTVAMAQQTAPAAPAPAPVVQRIPVVMVVDDSITMRKVTGRVLERHSMEVLTAKDGVDAVEKMAERVPDLVLLDIEMPRMDGYEVAQNMRSDPRLKDVPIIMITSRTGEKHRQRAMDIGVNRYLGKPYQEPELMRNVFEMLGLESVNG